MGYAPTSISEYKQFLGTRWLRSRIKMGNSKAFEIMEYFSRRKEFILLEEERYVTLIQYTRGFSVNDWTAEEDSDNEIFSLTYFLSHTDFRTMY